jgi:hypothetical protein
MEFIRNLTNKIFTLTKFLWSTFLMLTVIVLLAHSVNQLAEITEVLKSININALEVPKIIEDIRG